MNLDDDVATELDRLRRETGMGLSEALNELARVGVGARRRSHHSTYRQQTASLGIRVDVSNVGEVLDLLDDAP